MIGTISNAVDRAFRSAGNLAECHSGVAEVDARRNFLSLRDFESIQFNKSGAGELRTRWAFFALKISRWCLQQWVHKTSCKPRPKTTPTKALDGKYPFRGNLPLHEPLKPSPPKPPEPSMCGTFRNLHLPTCTSRPPDLHFCEPYNASETSTSVGTFGTWNPMCEHVPNGPGQVIGHPATKCVKNPKAYC